MKTLIAYFSASSVTEKTAKAIAETLGGDLFEIRPKEPYTAKDLNWMDPKSRSSVEMKDPSSRPEIAEKKEDIRDYDRVLVGFPIWWYTAPHIINAFFEENDLGGKDVYLFATSGGTGIDGAMRDLKKAYPAVSFKNGKLLNGKVTADAVQALIGQDL